MATLTRPVSAGDGELTVPDIDQDSGGSGYDLRITAADDGGAIDARLAVRRVVRA